MGTILVDGVKKEIDIKRLTLICHKGDVHIMPDGQVEIGPEQTLARASQVTDEEWVALKKDKAFCSMLEMVLGVGVFPCVDQLKDCGTGTRHIVGMILMFAELLPDQVPFIRYPESFLHPSSQVRLADLFLLLTGGK